MAATSTSKKKKKSCDLRVPSSGTRGGQVGCPLPLLPNPGVADIVPGATVTVSGLARLLGDSGEEPRSELGPYQHTSSNVHWSHSPTGKVRHRPSHCGRAAGGGRQPRNATDEPAVGGIRRVPQGSRCLTGIPITSTKSLHITRRLTGPGLARLWPARRHQANPCGDKRQPQEY